MYQPELSIRMQNTLPLTPGNPLKNMTGLARQISLPGEHAPIRFPSFPALERTAVIGFNQPASIPVSAQTPLSMTQFRQAAYPSWADLSRKYLAVVDGTVGQRPAGSTVIPGDSFSTPAVLSYQSWAVGSRSATATTVGVSTPTSSDYSYPIFGRDEALAGPEFVYVPKNSTLGVTVSVTSLVPAATTMLVTANLEFWANPGQSDTNLTVPLTIAANTSSGNVIITSAVSAGWYRVNNLAMTLNGNSGFTIGGPITYSLYVVSGLPTIIFTPGNASTAGNLAFGSVPSAVMHMPLVVPNEFANSAMPWLATRVTASAILGTNVTPVLNKGGTILGGRVSPAVRNAWLVDSAYISGLHPAEKAYLPMETGVYTFCPPSTDLVFFHDYTINTVDSAPEAPLFQLTNDSMYNKIFITVPIDGELACTVSWHLEFRTSSALFQVGLSAMTLESLHSAQLVLADLGFFFENPEHEKLITRVISGAKKFAPTIAGIYSPSLGRLVSSALGTVKPKKGPSKPPATTAAASGITPKQKKPAKAAKTGKANQKKK